MLSANHILARARESQELDDGHPHMCVKVRVPKPRVLPPRLRVPIVRQLPMGVLVSTPGANSEAAADGRLGVDDADDPTHMVSGANGVADTDVRQGEGVTSACVARNVCQEACRKAVGRATCMSLCMSITHRQTAA